MYLSFVSTFQIYTPLSCGEFQLIRQTLLIFFQDMHIRVSHHSNLHMEYMDKLSALLSVHKSLIVNSNMHEIILKKYKVYNV